jgi:hypothetical protein
MYANSFILNALTEFGESSDPLVKHVTEILQVEQREQDARLSILIQQHLAAGRSPVAIIDALVAVDLHLGDRGLPTPFATRLAPLAAEVMLYAGEKLLTERFEARAAALAPVFLLDKRTVVAAPPSDVAPEPFLQFSDRLLGIVQKNPVKKVVLHLPISPPVDPSLEPLIDVLIADLTTQGIKVETIV